MLKHLAIALLLTSCAATPPKLVESPSAAPVTPIAAAPVVQAPAPTCTRNHVALDLDIYTQCIFEGMSFVAVSNIIGFPGTPTASSGDSAVYQWRYNEGVMTATFVNNRLVSKGQSGLEACTWKCQ